jgi:hypothetical protein
MTKFPQALLSWSIRLGAVAVVAVLDYLITALNHGLITLPYPAITVPLVGNALAEADTWLVNWEKSNDTGPGALPPQASSL